MRKSLVITVTGPDRAGLVDALSTAVAQHGGNWEESRMARLAGQFAGIVHVSCAAEEAETLSKALLAIEREGLSVFVIEGSSELPSQSPKWLRLELIGTDRAGIIREISHALAERNVSVEELHTERQEAPHAGGMLFSARAKLRCPATLAMAELRSALERIASDLMVDLRLEA